MSDSLRHVLTEIYTPEVLDDADSIAPLGMTQIFGWSLTPEEVEELAAKLLLHAKAAREARA